MTPIHELTTVGSTNDEAFRLLEAGTQAPFIVRADRQTAGRGRRGRAWDSPVGNLHLTYALAPGDAARGPGVLPLAAGLALFDAVEQLAPALARRLALKWPNDLLIDGAKVAGLLLEAGDMRGVRNVVIGFGVNCAYAPTETLYRATSFSAAGAPVGPAELAIALRASMAERLIQWRSPARLADLLSDWRTRAGGVGDTITVRLPSEERVGRFEGLDEEGRLLLATKRGVETIHAGDVFLGPASGPAA